MNHITQSQTSGITAAADDGAIDPVTQVSQPTTRPKLDLSRLEPPADLEESSIEEMTIDGICGVY